MTDFENHSDLPNYPFSSNMTFCQEYQPGNPYCGIPRWKETLEVIFLIIIGIGGTLGNLLVICSIVFEKKVFKNGNIFVINLAVADLLISGIILPTIVLNIVKQENTLGNAACSSLGFLLELACGCSMCSMTWIALSRYCFVVHHSRYHSFFSKRNMVFMVALVWLWSCIVLSPEILGLGSISYDEAMTVCIHDHRTSIVFNTMLLIFDLFIPTGLVAFCYTKLFVFVRAKGKQLQKYNKSENYNNQVQQKNRLKREKTLLKTLAVTVAFFQITWLPIGIILLFLNSSASDTMKRVSARLPLLNASMNVIIYGLMNPVYRKGYYNFLLYLSSCNNSSNRTLTETSKELVHGSAKKQRNCIPKTKQSAISSDPMSGNHASSSTQCSNSSSETQAIQTNGKDDFVLKDPISST